jgi:uncharacterized protein (TIGR03437 family)
MKDLKPYFLCGLVVAALQTASAQTVFSTVPSRMVGQPTLQQLTITEQALNLVEGRELYAPYAIAVDTSVTPPILYVADTANSRVMAWKKAQAWKNGDFADLVIGQRDKYSTAANGPGTTLTSGLNAPTGLAVDKSGNLYVADAGNNRIVRYKTPFQQTGQLLAIDLIVGQKDSNGRAANEGLAVASAKTLNLAGFVIGITFDANGNLYVSDAGNNRVLRFLASALGPTASNEPAADMVLGQFDFATTKLPSPFFIDGKSTLAGPGGLTFSPAGQLFVTDSAGCSSQPAPPCGRVMVYVPPFQTGMDAARIIGVIRSQQGAPNPPRISESTLTGPNGVFFVGNIPYVLDTYNNRIIEYDPFNQWPLETATCGSFLCFSPPGKKIYGQSSFSTGMTNSGQPQPSDITFSLPTSAVVVGTDVIIADSGNNRVIAIPVVNNDLLLNASRVLGQIDFKYNSPNLIEGREFNIGNNFPGAVAVDNVSSTPHLYVADAGNNRVLGFKDARNVQPGQKADLVIGQPDFFTGVPNYPGGLTTTVTDSSLVVPEGVAVDSKGDLWVADSGNGRVLRFPRPFDQPPTILPRANLVIGQTDFHSRVLDASSQNMNFPIGMAFSSQGDLVVSDLVFNRILFFKKPPGGDFTSGQVATNVFGQPNYINTTKAELNNPRGIAVDTSDRLYVADTGNNRVVVYRNITQTGSDPAPVFLIPGASPNDAFSNPTSVAIDQTTYEIWVTDPNHNRVVRFPQFDTVTLTQTNNFILPDVQPIGVALDATGNPVTAEGINRVAFFYRAISVAPRVGYPGNDSGNAASYFYLFAPGMLATIKPSRNSNFGSATVNNSVSPVPTTLGDVQVLVGGVPSPLTFVSPGQINFMIPSSTPVGGDPVEFQVVKASTNAVLASYVFKIDPFSPGLFTADSTGTGQLSAVNVDDGQINGPAHPAKSGSYISLYGTGQGPVQNPPPDGSPPTGLAPTIISPRVFINNFEVSSTVQYSGLAPGAIGEWQINVQIPKDTPTGPASVVVKMADVQSNLDPFSGRLVPAPTIRVIFTQ